MAKRVFKNLNTYFEEASIPMLKEFSAKCFDTSGNFNILDVADNETRQKWVKSLEWLRKMKKANKFANTLSK